MSLEALRAQAHDLSRRLSEAANLADQLAVALQNYQPVPVKPTSPVEYALYCYNDPAIDARWTTQTLQGQPETVKRLPALRDAGVEKLHRYTNPLTRTANDKGIRQAYGVFQDTWLARDRNGQPIASTKFTSGPDHNFLIDVGLPEYQQESARYLVGKCQAEGWDGIYLDEINEYQSYAGYKFPANYATEYRFQLAQLAYVEHVSTAVENAGFQCHVNLAANDTAWRKNVATAVHGTHIEFFLVQWTVNDAWHIASQENGELKRQLDWVSWNETRGKYPICQADARNEAEVEYALASLLLVTQGKSRFAATKGGYGLGAGWWTSAMRTALLLGQPTGTYTVTGPGLYRREFDLGRVTVNPSEKPINTMPATSGLIELR